MKSRTTATVLCFFLGGLGFHRFYLGQTGLGILYLIFCWTFIPTIIAIIDFIGFLLMSEETFNQKYNLLTSILITKTAQQIPPTAVINMDSNQSNSINSSSEEIKKLYELKEMGIITQEEFDLKKKKLL